MKIVPIVQGTPEWYAWRDTGLGASYAPIIMGVSPHRTPYQLWAELTGNGPAQEENAAMRRGTALEPEARRLYEAQTGNIAEPVCCEHPELPWMLASLDGADMDGTRIVEIKTHGKDDHESVLAGRIPDKDYPQVQHQLAVSGARCVDYVNYHDGKIAIATAYPAEAYIMKLVEMESAFWRLVQTNTPPELTDRDIVERDDEAWREATNVYLKIRAARDDIDAAFEESINRLKDLAKHAKERGNGVTVTRYFKKGNVNYKAVPELKGVDLEQYRAKGRTETRITVEQL